MANSITLSKNDQKIHDKYTYALGELSSNVYHITKEILNESKENKYSPNQSLLIETYDKIQSQITERFLSIENKSPNFTIDNIKHELPTLKDESKQNPLVMLAELEKMNLNPSVAYKNGYGKEFYETNIAGKETVFLQNEKVFLSNDLVDKSIKLPDRNEIAQNPFKYEAEKGIDRNGINEAPAKSVNTIAEDYIKGQEKQLQQRISLADHFADKESKISYKR